MSDATEAAERALRALEAGGSSTTPLLGPKMERSPSPRQRPSSPDVVCPICLGDITNKAVTDSCLHSFCFSCLSEWSKVKPECPLCKQKFSIIYHSIKSMVDYQEHRLMETPTDVERAAHALVAQVGFDPQIFINVAVQRRATRFGYRTTMGLNRTPRSPLMFWMPNGSDVTQRRIPQILRNASHGNPAFATSSTTATRSSTWTTRLSSIEFRRNIYQQNMWVRASEGDRIRESSPEFYRSNPAQTHRLVPWLNRELSVLLDVNVPYYHEVACREIMNWITLYPINSFDFKRLVQSYFGGKTNHFVHEFYHFAISPFDMQAYDDHSRYTPSNAELESVAPTDDLVLDNLSADGQLDPSQLFRGPEMNSMFGFPVPPGVSGRSANLLRRPEDSARPPPPSVPSSSEVIILSSDEEPAAHASDDSDSEVVIIGSLPPMHLRNFEVISVDDSDDSDVIEIKPATPPLIEIPDDDSNSHSPSTSNGVAGTSTSAPDGHRNSERTARFFRPSYREYSSSSDEEITPKKRASKRKGFEKKRLLSKYKSSKYVDESSTDLEDSGEFRKRENEGLGKKERSSDSDSETATLSRRRKSRETRSSKNSTEKKSSPSSSKFANPKRRQSSESSKNKYPLRRKKRGRSGCSDSSSDRCSRSKRNFGSGFNTESQDESRSSLSIGVENDFSTEQNSSKALAPNPKALSKKAIILNKRKSEMFDQSEVGGPSSCGSAKNEDPSLSASDSDRDELGDSKQDMRFRISNNPGGSVEMESDVANQLPGISVYSSDTSSSILSMGQECGMPELDSRENNVSDSSLRTPSVDVGLETVGRDDAWNLSVSPSRPPRISSTSSSSSSDSSNSSSSILNVTSVEPLPLDQSNHSYPELNLGLPMGDEDVSPVASSPPNLRRFDDAGSPFISLNHSPLQSDSSSTSCSQASVSSPPRLRSIVFLGDSRPQSYYNPTSPASTTSNEDY